MLSTPLVAILGSRFVLAPRGAAVQIFYPGISVTTYLVVVSHLILTGEGSLCSQVPALTSSSSTTSRAIVTTRLRPF
ncbi:MAG: hypothetical protein AUI95_02255 [Crenarchaeota archaeon 13_1_40CM_3_52_4]|nr:MAG: hypothetical protein AUI95_02255 [Crenarchaeota archaeon 13_1_40CM_3_52_4]